MPSSNFCTPKILENQRKHKCTNVFHELINTVAHEALQMTNWIINIYYKICNFIYFKCKLIA